MWKKYYIRSYNKVFWDILIYWTHSDVFRNISSSTLWVNCRDVLVFVTDIAMTKKAYFLPEFGRISIWTCPERHLWQIFHTYNINFEQSVKSNALLLPTLWSVNEKPAELLCLRPVPNYLVVSNQLPAITMIRFRNIELMWIGKNLSLFLMLCASCRTERS